MSRSRGSLPKLNTTIHPNNEIAVRMRKLFILLPFPFFFFAIFFFFFWGGGALFF